jgi:hypothetical protein
MTLINHYRGESVQKIRRNSAGRDIDKNNLNNDEDLMRIRLLVNKS